MGFNSAFKGLKRVKILALKCNLYAAELCDCWQRFKATKNPQFGATALNYKTPFTETYCVK
jgi:hypothetical protein